MQFDEDTSAVTDAQLEQLRTSSNVTRALHSSELRDIITAIDAAPDRRTALEKMLHENLEFAQFVDEMMGSVGFKDTGDLAGHR